MKPWKKLVLVLAILFVLQIVLCGSILYLSKFHLDLSQDYRRVDGYEDIVFKDPSGNQCYRLCAWGLVRTDDKVGFEDHRDPDVNTLEYQLLVDKVGAENIWQVVPSPDGRYILYAERVYRGTGITDDEDVYYKVYSADDDTSITVFSGYREFLMVDWG